MRHPDRYRACVGIMLCNAAGLVWVGERLDNRNAWQMPQGGIEPGETPGAAARRELAEETGVTAVTVLAEHPEWLYYDLPPDLRASLWDGRYAGQRQKWFAFRYLGTDRDINIATEHPEFAAWRWVPPVSLPGQAVSFKRDLYKRIVRDFGPVCRGSGSIPGLAPD